jgi:hypothetical protein
MTVSVNGNSLLTASGLLTTSSACWGLECYLQDRTRRWSLTEYRRLLGALLDLNLGTFINGGTDSEGYHTDA